MSEIEVEISDENVAWLLADGSLVKDHDGTLRVTDKMVAWLHDYFEKRRREHAA